MWTQRHAHRGKNHVKRRQRVGFCIFKPRNAKDCSEPLKLGEGYRTDGPSPLSGEPPCQQLDLELPALGTVTKYISVG